MWKQLKNETQKEYFKNILKFLDQNKDNLAPPREKIFRAFEELELAEVKVVILGQDPYPTPGDANGRAFAVNPEVKIPKSLKNIFKEIQQEFGVEPQDKTLESIASQGVLLLNTCLSTSPGEAFAHKNLGWQKFTDAAIKALNERKDPVIFMLWGAPAHEKEKLITNSQHFILKAPHPSPLSAYRGFFGCNHFIKANEILKRLGKKEIRWTD